MILTLLGSLGGFAASAVPRIFDMVDEWQDRKHESEMVKLNMEAAKIQHELRLEEINAQADIAQTKAIYQLYKRLVKLLRIVDYLILRKLKLSISL